MNKLDNNAPLQDCISEKMPINERIDRTDVAVESLDLGSKISMTGDRPTGKLHLGHYVGSLQKRLELQSKVARQYVMVADFQALTDNYDRSGYVKQNIVELMYDYLSIGLDPKKNIFLLQSEIPALYEITCYYLNLVTVAQLGANPTVRQELKDRGFGEYVPAGFFCYPVSQAADITAFKADLVPVGADQLPMIETTNRIVQKFTAHYGSGYLKEVKALLSTVPRLEGIYGKAKASKSSNNAIFLCDTDEEVKAKVAQMYTDPNHLKATDPGQIEGNVVFSYLEAFWKDRNSLKELKEAYQKGGIGDAHTKKILCEVLLELMEPIRKARAELTEEYALEVLREGTEVGRQVAEETLQGLKRGIWENLSEGN